MNLLLAAVFALTQAPAAPAPGTGIQVRTFESSSGRMTYAISMPSGYDSTQPAPLVLVLHPGGGRMPFYGRSFLRSLAGPALANLRAIMVAPDCPTNSWTDAESEAAVIALVNDTVGRHNIDRRRVLVTGFSMGGRGTWFMSSRHADLFTAAIPMASSSDRESLDLLGRMPTYVIHSRDDEVSPFEADERRAKQLADMGRPVYFEALEGLGHFEMSRYADALRRGGQWVSRQWETR